MATQTYPKEISHPRDPRAFVDAVLKREHKICLIAARRSREDGDMAGAADFLHDAAMNRLMIIIERGRAQA